MTDNKPPSSPVDWCDYTITVEAFNMTKAQYHALFVRVADAAHVLDEEVCVGGKPTDNDNTSGASNE